MQKLSYYWIFLLFLVLQLTGCSTTHHRYTSDADGAPTENIDVSKIPDAVPKAEPFSRYGNPKSYVVLGQRYYVLKTYQGYDQTGIASWYGTKFHAQRTSSGEPYDLATMTAAHKTLPIPCYVRVTNLQNNHSVIVKVNDRGPFHENRIIDLSYVAAKKLGVTAKGTALVRVTAIDPHHPQDTPAPEKLISDKPQIYMQIGAFAIKENADNLAKQIKHYTSNPIVIKPGILNAKNIYRVQIGPIPSVDKSDSLTAALQQANLGKPITVIQ